MKILNNTSAITAVALTCTAAVFKLVFPIKASAWWADSHREITLGALALLEREKKIKQADFFKPYSEQLLKGCVDPDNDGDPDKGAGTHYYSCALPNGKRLPQKNGYFQNRLGSYARSARTSVEENYTSAVILYQNNRPSDAMYLLGRAIHFVEDISCPVHTANMHYLKKPTNPHHSFEKFANTIIGRYKPEKFDKRLSKSYSEPSFEKPLNKLVAASNRYAADIQRLDQAAYERAVADMAPTASQNAAALMLRFYDDCKNGAGFSLIDGRKYSVRNLGSGLLIIAGKKSPELTPSGKQDPEKQKLIFEISIMGSFAFKASNGSYLSADMKKYETPKEGIDPAQFRFFYLGKDRFRISVKASGYGKMLTCTKKGTLAVADYDPADLGQVWVIG